MRLDVIKQDGSVSWSGVWDLNQTFYKKGDQILTVLKNDGSVLKTQADPIWSNADNCYIYAVYTYERKTN